LLEEILYWGWSDEDDENDFPRPANLDRWFMNQVMDHAVRLWRGGQVDGSVWEWESEFDARQFWRRDSWVTDPKVLIASRDAVMAGYRYVTSFKSTPRYLRAPMHEDLR